MSLSTNKINKIKAEWKTGKYPSAYALSKAMKVSDKTVTKLIDGLTHSNADIIDICVIAENAKKSVKNPIEKRAIEQAVKERTIAEDIRDIALEATLINIKGIKKDVAVDKVSMYDRKLGQDTIDKALISAEVAPRHASSTVNVNQSTQVQQNIAIDWD